MAQGVETIRYQNSHFLYVGSKEPGKQKPQGPGKLYVGNDILEGTFSAEGELTGSGCKRWFANGNVYEGDMRYGEMEGTGTLHMTGGGVYVGSFSSNRFNGQGTLIMPNPSGGSWLRYVGGFKNHKKEGQGLLYEHADRECSTPAVGMYDGHFEAGQKAGKGAEQQRVLVPAYTAPALPEALPMGYDPLKKKEEEGQEAAAAAAGEVGASPTAAAGAGTSAASPPSPAPPAEVPYEEAVAQYKGVFDAGVPAGLGSMSFRSPSDLQLRRRTISSESLQDHLQAAAFSSSSSSSGDSSSPSSEQCPLYGTLSYSGVFQDGNPLYHPFRAVLNSLEDWMLPSEALWPPPPPPSPVDPKAKPAAGKAPAAKGGKSAAAEAEEAVAQAGPASLPTSRPGAVIGRSGRTLPLLQLQVLKENAEEKATELARREREAAEAAAKAAEEKARKEAEEAAAAAAAAANPKKGAAAPAKKEAAAAAAAAEVAAPAPAPPPVPRLVQSLELWESRLEEESGRCWGVYLQRAETASTAFSREVLLARWAKDEEALAQKIAAQQQLQQQAVGLLNSQLEINSEDEAAVGQRRAFVREVEEGMVKLEAGLQELQRKKAVLTAWKNGGELLPLAVVSGGVLPPPKPPVTAATAAAAAGSEEDAGGATASKEETGSGDGSSPASPSDVPAAVSSKPADQPQSRRRQSVSVKQHMEGSEAAPLRRRGSAGGEGDEAAALEAAAAAAASQEERLRHLALTKNGVLDIRVAIPPSIVEGQYRLLLVDHTHPLFYGQRLELQEVLLLDVLGDEVFPPDPSAETPIAGGHAEGAAAAAAGGGGAAAGAPEGGAARTGATPKAAVASGPQKA